MLRKLRITIAIVLFALITFYFLDFAGLLSDKFHIIAHFQLIPALLAFQGIILVFIFILTLLFGRIYCSTICPLGTFQDISGWISKRTGKKKKRYTYSRPKNILRWSIFGSVTLLFLIGFPVALSLIEPYSAYGRMATHVFKPIYMFINNLLAAIFSSFGNYTFYKVDIYILSIFSFVTALITFLAIGFLAWKYGRTYCNTICPTGTLLGFLSKYSFFKIKINPDKCNSCGLCSAKCKASCISTSDKKIDHSRCVDCFNCLEVCKRDALKFASSVKKKNAVAEPNNGRRRFLLTSVVTLAGIPAVFAKTKKGVFSRPDKSTPRTTAISPPGSISVEHLQRHCTSCHLCISKCPSNVLKPAFMEYGLEGILQPVMYFKKGFCNYDCIVCSAVCPNGALTPLTVTQKHAVQVGRVVLRWGRCIVNTERTHCGACSEHCPTQAVKMIPFQNGLTRPVVDKDICVGCGGCEFICPVRPYPAIYIEGNAVHQEAKAFEEEKKETLQINDFGF